jgi:hypothetical protein
LHTTWALPKKLRGTFVVTELKLEKQIKYCSLHKTGNGDSKFVAFPPKGTLVAIPVKELQGEFQLQRKGAI